MQSRWKKDLEDSDITLISQYKKTKGLYDKFFLYSHKHKNPIHITSYKMLYGWDF